MLATVDAAALRRWCSAAVDALETHRAEIDDLNVYPVPDGDTGTNLLLTMRAGVESVRREQPADLPAIAAVLARGALLGARGNSGIILSQILRGLAEAFTGASEADGAVLADGLRRAAALAWAAVAEPVEGTVLTVAREAAEAARMALASGADLSAVTEAAAARAAEALARTPTQLAALGRAGVVDAGGRGLVVLLDALSAIVSGRAPERHTAPVGAAREVDRPALERAREGGSTEFGYEVQYLLDAEPAAVRKLSARLGGLGDSLVVVGDGAGAPLQTWHVHVHVNDVGAAIEAGVEAGRPHQITVSRFADQTTGHRSGAAWSGVAVVAVTPGDEMADLFEGEGITVVRGGQAKRPSTGVILDAVRATGAASVVILPNDADSTGVADIAAAEARDGGQDVAVVPTHSPVQGLAAIAVHDPTRRFGDDVISMAEAAAATRWAEVTVAQREALTMVGRCQAGDCLGLIQGDVVLIGDTVQQVARDLLDRMLLTGGELITVILGADVTEAIGVELERHVAQVHPEVEVVVYRGGQPDYPLLLGVE